MSDDRIPVRIVPPAPGGPPPGTALVVEWSALVPRSHPLIERLAPGRAGHAAACPCCAPRAALATALHRLFLRRAQGAAPWFDRVEVRSTRVDPAALADPLVASRFRLAAEP
ncbi:hypothetical protein [Elioraea sp.]|jgi:hypothetical protein|uniref:hypothetical protein n=1 Tax=Elioraea sp. TaxID=2185103 RepID=UPI0021DCDF89|nr:hypothetical protein [Elioraea sp.]GIX09363.1 MAG: hypothetical protein KatS3mg116_1073 [Elioraea sp.]